MADTADPLILQATLLASLLSQNDATLAALVSEYAKVYEVLAEDWLRLLRDLQDAKARSDQSGITILTLRADRVLALQQQTVRQIARFTERAERLVRADQRVAVAAAQTHAAAVVRLGMQHPRLPFAQLPASALESLVGRFSNGMPLRALFDTMGPEAAESARGVLFQAMATGQNPKIAARKLTDELGVPLTRAMTIARTEMLGSYRAATMEAYRRNSDVVRAWRWNAHLDSACPSCMALHGSIHPLTEPMREHVNGRCVASPVLVEASAFQHETGPDFFDGLSETAKRDLVGPTKYDLLRRGQLDIEDLVYADTSAIWGVQYREASLAQALFNHSLGGERFSYEVD